MQTGSQRHVNRSSGTTEKKCQKERQKDLPGHKSDNNNVRREDKKENIIFRDTIKVITEGKT